MESRVWAGGPGRGRPSESARRRQAGGILLESNLRLDTPPAPTPSPPSPLGALGQLTLAHLSKPPESTHQCLKRETVARRTTLPQRCVPHCGPLPTHFSHPWVLVGAQSSDPGSPDNDNLNTPAVGKPGRKKNPKCDRFLLSVMTRSAHACLIISSQAARRDQNRIAQREFRLRKQQRVSPYLWHRSLLLAHEAGVDPRS